MCKNGGGKMRFSKIADYELARLFVHAKKEKIEQLLSVCDLDTYTASEIICDFIKKHADEFWNNNSNRYAPLFDDVFFCVAINELKSAQNNGIDLDGGSRFIEPNITYVS